jgi:hypothetical protein
MDDHSEVAVVDNVGDPHSAWKWVKGGVYDLVAGGHVFALS